MKFKLNIFLATIFFTFLVACYPVSCFSSEQIDETIKNLPKWIIKEKVRAGFLYAKDDTKYAALMRTHGLNTAIMSGFVNRKHEFPKVINDYRRWARVCKKEGLYVFASCYWQPAPKSWSLESWQYREVVYSDGSVGKAPCPRDRRFWRDYLTYVGKKLAKMSLDPELQVDGIFLDCELYGTKPSIKRHYGRHTCFCDNCFSSYLLSKNYNGSKLPVLGYGDRKKWLEEKKLIDSYFDFLAKDVESLASEFEREIHKINPHFVIGMYQKLRNWVLKAIARGIETDTMPILLFATDTYSRGGASKIPDNPREYYAKEQQINIIYAAGFLLRKYSSYSLEKALPIACRKGDGYWLFSMHLLWDRSAQYNKLIDGSASGYWQGLKRANNNIDIFIKETSSIKTGF